MRTGTGMAKPTVAVLELSNPHTSKRRRMYDSALVARNLMFAHWFAVPKHVNTEESETFQILSLKQYISSHNAIAKYFGYRQKHALQMSISGFEINTRFYELQTPPEQRTPNTDPRVPLVISAYANVKIRITKSNAPEQRRQPYTRGHQDSRARIKTLKYVLIIS